MMSYGLVRAAVVPLALFAWDAGHRPATAQPILYHIDFKVDPPQPSVGETFLVTVSITSLGVAKGTPGSFVGQFQGKALPYPDGGKATQITFNGRGTGGFQRFQTASATAGSFPFKASFLGPLSCSGKLINGLVDCRRPTIVSAATTITVAQPTGSMDLVCVTGFGTQVTPAPSQCGSVGFWLTVTNTGPTDAFGSLNYMIGSQTDGLTCAGNTQSVSGNTPNLRTPAMLFPAGKTVRVPNTAAAGFTTAWNPGSKYTVQGDVWRDGLQGASQPAACHQLVQTISP